VPQAGERSGEVRGQGRLADAALAARHRDHARGRADGDSRRALGDAAAQPLGERAFSSGVMTSKPSPMDSTPSTGASALCTCSSKLARSGQPGR
jgi:hypothetical protein